FEHSVGVYLLLHQYGAPLEEQIAGLIHDVSHTAFSHIADYVLSNSGDRHDFQDSVFERFVKNSEIPAILQKHGFDLENILDDSRHPLKENENPDICADRIDNCLRDALAFKELSDEDLTYLLGKLKVQGNRWFFADYASARKISDLFSKCNRIYWAGITTGVMHISFGEYLKRAIAQNYITREDLFLTDEEVLKKIEKYHKSDELLRLYFDRASNKVGYRNDPDDYEVEVVTKSRVIDPWCLHEGVLQRVSEVDPAWAEVVKEELQPKRYFLKFDR
ncbi:MAG: HD domain-containing protein, partial [bacterium]